MTLGSILVAFAGLMGAAGVSLAAVAAHAAPSTGLDSAAYMLLAHAAGVAALGAALECRLVWRPLGTIAAVGLIAGQALFAADIAVRALMHGRLFPFAAPIGGTLTILAWVAVALAAVLALAKRQP